MESQETCQQARIDFRLSGERPECTDNFVALYFTGFAPVAQFKNKQ
jgi:hypothetical protein